MSLPVAILAIGVLIAIHEAGHFAVARKMGMRVMRFSVGFFKAIWSYTSKKSGTIYQIGILPLGGFVQIKGMNPFEEDAYTDPESYQNKAVWRRVLVLIAGPGANLILAFFILFFLYASSGAPRYLDKSGVGTVVPGSPAAAAGLEAGDEILTADGVDLKTWEDLTTVLRAAPGRKVQLEVKRDDSRMVLFVTPKDEKGVGKIGIGQPQELISMPVHLAALAAAIKCGQVVGDSLSAIARLVSFQGGEVDAVGLPGIVKTLASALDAGLRDFLAITAYLSLMLFLFNLLPFPALDGGRGVFLIYELVTRRRVSPKVDVIVNTAGFILLIGLLIFMSIRDLSG